MKAKAGFIALMLGGYLFFLAVDAPAQLLSLLLPREIAARGLSGTLWQGAVDVVRWRGIDMGSLNWRVTFSDLMPALTVAFRHPDGPQGQGTIRGWQQPQLYQWRISVPAGYVLHKLPLIVPISAQGDVQLNLQQAVIGPQGCRSLAATLKWPGAALGTPLGTVALAQPQAQLRCREGRLEIDVRQQSSFLQLSGQGSLARNGEYQFDGRLANGSAMPEAIGRLLAMQGKADTQGGRLLRFQGRLPL